MHLFTIDKIYSERQMKENRCAAVEDKARILFTD